VLSALVASSARLSTLLASELPGVTFRPPQASYLAWLDLRALGWGDDPAAQALSLGVALNSGSTFGTQGRGFARLNFACSPEVLDEAIARLAAGRE
jgi:cystathionine beta-lyase